jgi:hypothetical protein
MPLYNSSYLQIIFLVSLKCMLFRYLDYRVVVLSQSDCSSVCLKKTSLFDKVSIGFLLRFLFCCFVETGTWDSFQFSLGF